MKRLYETLLEYPEKGYYPAHMPGHKGNISGGFLREALRYDITEIDGFDNLHDAKGIIRESEEYAAYLYGSSETHFLVGGSTLGVLSAVFGTAGPGDKVIIARNCHRSVYNAVCEGRLECRYVYPEYMEGPGFVGEIRPDLIEEAVNRDPDAGVVVITSPTYEGVCSDISAIAGICHRYNKILIVDAAHGAHFGFCDTLPASAVRQGADIVIHSVHKTLPAPTQTALIHINGSLVNRDSIRRKLKIYQSSSPSYLLMAGIDMCMSLIGDNGKELFEAFGYRLNKLDKGLKELKCLKHLSRELLISEEGLYDHDPGKLIISTVGTGITGRDLYDILRNEYAIQPEMAAETYCLMILTLMDEQEGFDRVENAIKCIDEKLFAADNKRKGNNNNSDTVCRLYAKRAKQIITAYKAFEGSRQDIEAADAKGLISADYISLYPPGIPLLVPGEEITAEHIEGIEEAMRSKLNVQGITKDGRIGIVAGNTGEDRWERFFI